MAERCPICDRPDCARQRIHGTPHDGHVVLGGTEILECRRNRVDWRARALAAEAKPPCTCGSGAHPRHCLLHPDRYALHVAELNADTYQEKIDDLERDLEAANARALAAEARVAKVRALAETWQDTASCRWRCAHDRRLCRSDVLALLDEAQPTQEDNDA